jgi:hypothetical protein
MKQRPASTFRVWPALLLLVCCVLSAWSAEPNSPAPAPGKGKASVLLVKGVVEVSWAGTKEWVPASTNTLLSMGDRLRTGNGSQTAIRLTDSSLVRLGEFTTVEIRTLPVEGDKPGFDVKGGLLHFFSRERTQNELKWRAPVASGAIRGTEFTVQVREDGRTDVTVLEGEVELSNEAGKMSGNVGQIVSAEAGRTPELRAALDAKAAIQWCLYYPGILDIAELWLEAAPRAALDSSIAAWRRGDLRQAVALVPPGWQPASVPERVYAASLALGVGQVTQAQDLLKDQPGALAEALRLLVATVQLRPGTPVAEPSTATGWMARSYAAQADHDIPGALDAARRAVELSPDFGFGWARVAELEFSSGRLFPMDQALARALELAPSNAQAWTLSGFVALARDQVAEAVAAFEHSMALDGTLANAWLGRGLCRFRERRVDEGIADLQTAALLEPNRSLLRSYLGKGYQHAASFLRNFSRREELLAKAAKELAIAHEMDPRDPTPCLYQALLAHQRFATAEAIEDLQRSQDLNQERALYRSRMLLDQDQAVRGANLARIYQDAGMDVVSRRESARAVMQDYANASAHLNLASSFNALRDPSRFNLRHESEWFNEHLLATMLAPVEGGSLSQNISEQEYSRAFVSDRFGGSSATEYQSGGDFHELASQFGVLGSLGYAVDLDFLDRNGARPNGDVSRLDLVGRVKEQFGPHDSLLLMAAYQDFESGDVFQYYNPASARLNYRFHEQQEPLLVAGYHHEWSPGVHTLVMAGRLTDAQQLTDPGSARRLVLPRNASPLATVRMDLEYENSMELFMGEWNQIVQGEKHTDVFGVRLVGGDFDATSRFSNPPPALAAFWPAPLVSQGGGVMERVSAYAYHTWAIRTNLLVTAGLSYDRLTLPLNYRRAPVQTGDERVDKWSPKAALVWNPSRPVTVRLAYAQALGGVSYDDSVRLEPTQLAGFSQSHRSLISESIVGSVEAPRYDLWGAGLDVNLSARTFVTFEARLMRERVDRWSGAIYLDQFAGTTRLAPFEEDLRYRERSLSLTVNQILAEDFFLEAGYQVSWSKLWQRQALVPGNPAQDRRWWEASQLQVVQAGLAYRPRQGWFGRMAAAWYFQENDSTVAARPGDHVPQVEAWVGWQFPLRRGEVSVGVLNLLDEDYRLYPLNYYWELPRVRTFCARMAWRF